VIEQMAELHQHITQGRFGPGDPHDLFLGEREHRWQLIGVGNFVEGRADSCLDHSANKIRRGGFKPKSLHCAVSRNMNRVIQTILNVSVEGRHKAIPESPFRKDQETQPVNLVHHLHDSGKECLGDSMGIIASASKEQIFQLVEGNNHGSFQGSKDLGQYLEQRQNKVLTCGSDVEIQFGKTICKEVRK
jgi:hypothetical protein